MIDLADEAFAKELAEAQHKAMYAPKGKKLVREAKVYALRHAQLKRELGYRRSYPGVRAA